MEKEFIPYEQALALKELGFDEPCFAWFTGTHLRIGFVESKHVQGENEILAPLYQQAFRWFREKHDIHSQVYSDASGGFKFYVDWGFGIHTFKNVYSYEEAQFECIKKLIEIVKNK